ncbi:MAG: hypothetical protein ACJZ1R_01840 [Candidatus Neomarinimicrobiota bacterium]
MIPFLYIIIITCFIILLSYFIFPKLKKLLTVTPQISVNFIAINSQMLKQLLTITLTLLFLERDLHFDHTYHQDSNTYSFCKEGCKDKNCSTSVHDCKKCLNQNNRYIVSNSFDLLSRENESNIISFKDAFKNNPFPTDLSGRSPPQVS